MEPINNSPQSPVNQDPQPPIVPPQPEATPQNPASPVPSPVPAAAAPPASIPDAWPGAFGVYKYSKQAIKINLGTVIILLILSSLIGGFGAWKKLHGAGNLISLLVNSLLIGSLALTTLAGVRGQHRGIGEALSKGASFWLKLIGLTILVYASYFLSALLLIVPLFFVLPRLTLANYFLVDKNLGVIEAYKASWQATKGHALKAWGIIGVTLLIAILMITIIGIPFSIYFYIMYSAAFAVFYEVLNRQQSVGGNPQAAYATPIAGQPQNSVNSNVPPPVNSV